MEPAIDPLIIEHLPRPLTLSQHAVVTLWELTGCKIIAYQYQVSLAEVFLTGRDAVCIAGTGCGKSMAYSIYAPRHYAVDYISLELH
jgi:hypothetical protein